MSFLKRGRSFMNRSMFIFCRVCSVSLTEDQTLANSLPTSNQRHFYFNQCHSQALASTQHGIGTFECWWRSHHHSWHKQSQACPLHLCHRTSSPSLEHHPAYSTTIPKKHNELRIKFNIHTWTWVSESGQDLRWWLFCWARRGHCRPLKQINWINWMGFRMTMESTGMLEPGQVCGGENATSMQRKTATSLPLMKFQLNQSNQTCPRCPYWSDRVPLPLDSETNSCSGSTHLQCANKLWAGGWAVLVDKQTF